MSIDLRQISAGMALVSMTPTELAGASGLDTESFMRILNSEVSPRPETLDRIRIALEARQVEFGPRSGVALKDNYMRRLTGVGFEAYFKLYDEILRTMLGRSDDVLFFLVNPQVSGPELKEAKARLYDAGIRCRHICPEGTTVFDAPREDYRAMPRKYFANQPQVVYSHYVATTNADDDFNVLIFNSHSISQAERSKFDFIWDHCAPV
jgi:hypothetical protein